jgi:hypothetical protein
MSKKFGISKGEYARLMGFNRSDLFFIKILNTPHCLNELNMINWNYRSRYWTVPEIRILETYFGKVIDDPYQYINKKNNQNSEQ